ncbi:hypothetical protein [Bosea sp. TAF32]|uniref:hypothetical protein n=1 Tax=Bosea sp. TAF32 TaxID=3237482 RepID=UPI003F913C39
MRGLLAIFWAVISAILAAAARVTLFPSRWLAAGAEWCDRKARALNEGDRHE